MSIDHFNIQSKWKYIQIVDRDDTNNDNNYTITNSSNALFAEFFARNFAGNRNKYNCHIIILSTQSIKT